MTTTHPPIPIMLIGAGRMGHTHAQALATLANRYRVSGIVDCDHDAALRAADRLSITGHPPPAIYGDTHHAFAVDESQACLIATPTPTHLDIVKAALESGRYVFCEKPLTFDVETSLRLGELAQQRQLTLAVGFYRRFCDTYCEARSILQSGDLGTPVLIRACQWDAAAPAAEFLTGSGGLAVDCGIHEFDMVEWLLGQRISHIRATALTVVSPDVAAAGDVDNLLIEATLDRTTAIIDLSRNCGYDDDVRTEILTTQGALFIETTPRSTLTVGSARGRHTTIDEAATFEHGVARELEAFADALVHGKSHNLAGAIHSARALEVARAVNLSVQSGETIDLR